MKKIIRIGLALAIVGFLMPLVMSQPVLAMTGSGTEGDPYIISSLADLQAMADGVTYAADAYYELANGIDASATTTWNWDAGRGVYEGFLPREFEGHFDGNYYAITGLYIDRYRSGGWLGVGLFSTTTRATVTSVYLIDVDLTVEVTGTIYTCEAGAVVGSATFQSTIQDVYATGTVSATCTDTGGAGHGSANAGGLVGRGSESQLLMEECGAYVTVYAIALDTAISRAGGLVGTYGSYSGIIRNCYARGSVTATYDSFPSADAGGLVGYHWSAGLIDNCYSTGVVATDDDAGGLVSQFDLDTTDSFWDTETSGQSTSAGGTGKTTVEMKTESTFTNAGWDFTTIWDMKQYVNDGYPYLLWWYDPEPFAEWVQILLFEPITIISGTTLPDRAGAAQNGAITWGDNPAGIAIDMGELVSDNQPPIVSTPDNPATPLPDMTGESGQPDWTATQPTLTDNPFYPIVDLISGQMNIPLWLVWVILALFILLIIMAVSFRYAPHQLITALAGGGWCAFMYHMGIFPFWVMFIFAAMALAIVIGERTPTVS